MKNGTQNQAAVAWSCLNPNQVEERRIQALMEQELRLAASFQALSGRHGRQKRTLRSMAADNLHSARELRSAYFFMTGVQLAPEQAEPLPLSRAYEAALRSMYDALKRLAQRYGESDTVDVCLREIYLRAAEQLESQRRLLRSLIAQL